MNKLADAMVLGMGFVFGAAIASLVLGFFVLAFIILLGPALGG
jgi:hypothetical protein